MIRKISSLNITLILLGIIMGILTGCNYESTNTATNYKTKNTTTKVKTGIKNQINKADAVSSSTSYPNLSRFQMLDADDGFAWGATNNRFQIEKTVDGGIHWQSVSNKLQLPQFSKEEFLNTSGFFLNAKEGWISYSFLKGNPRIFLLHTNDGGANWKTTQLHLDGIGIKQIDFVNDHLGWILTTSEGAMGHTAKSIYQTADGGSTWKLVSQDTGYIPMPHPTKNAIEQFGYVTGMKFSDAKTGWVGLNYGISSDVQIYKTQDEGKTWYLKSVPVLADFKKNSYSITYPPILQNGQGSLPVVFKSQNQTVLEMYGTQNGGDFWNAIGELKLTEVPLLSQVNKNLIWAYEQTAHTLWITNDGGHTWKKRANSVIPTQLVHANVTQIQVINDQQGWALVDGELTQDSSIQYELYSTMDGGATWKKE